MFIINSCRSNETIYDGESLLLFTAPQSSAKVLVLVGTGSSNYNIGFGVAKQVDADSDVTLVIDNANSTAKEGVDYTLASKTTTLKAGTSTGSFPIKLLEGGAIQSGKTIAFKLTSTTLKNAVFNQNFTINVSLTCPVSSFVGKFTNTSNYIYAAGGVYNVVQSGVANQIIVKDFFDVGLDLTLNYDPTTYIISVPSGQSTGYVHPKYGLIQVTQSSDASQVSSFNPCTRVMDLYLKYYVSAGSFGNKKISFTGS